MLTRSPLLFNMLQEPDSLAREVSSEELNLVNYALELQRRFENLCEEDLKNVTHFSMGNKAEEYRSRLYHVSEMNILNINLVVQFVKNLPGIESILPEDVKTLLRAHTSEILILRAVREYDFTKDALRGGNGQFYDRDFYRRSNLGEFGEHILSFCKTLADYKIRDVEYATLSAVVLLSHTDELLEPFKVRHLKNAYFTALRNYIFTIRQDMDHFNKLIGILGRLKNLADIYALQPTNLGELPKLSPFLESVYRK